jgi:TolA-binding protein
MASPITSPDWAYVVGAAVTAGPAYLLARRNKSAAAVEGQATRTAVTDALNEGLGRLNGRIDAMHSDVSELAAWQAEHTTEHAVFDLTRGRKRIERRD